MSSKLTLDAFRATMSADEMANCLELIASQLRDGYESGDAHGAGWWIVEGLAEDDPEAEDNDGDS